MEQRTVRLGVGFLFFFFLGFVSGSGAQEREQAPVDLGIQEEARVRLSIIDVVVIDREGRTVPGLNALDFKITAGRRDVPVASVDASCPGGGADDPRAAYGSDSPGRGAAPPGERKIALALDYFHAPRR